MNKIPKTSQVSLFRGLWFIFRDGKQEIAAYYSAITGQERMFINGELISKKTSLSRTSEHQFSVNGNIYKTIFYAPQMLEREIKCFLIKDGKCIKGFKTSYKYKFRIFNFIAKLLIGLLGGAVIGYLFAFFNLPLWLFVFTVLILVLIGILQETKKIVIEQIDV